MTRMMQRMTMKAVRTSDAGLLKSSTNRRIPSIIPKTESSPLTNPNSPRLPIPLTIPEPAIEVATTENSASTLVIASVKINASKLWWGVRRMLLVCTKECEFCRTKTKPAKAIEPMVPTVMVSC